MRVFFGTRDREAGTRVGNWEPNQEPGTGNCELETRNRELGTRTWELGTGNYELGQGFWDAIGSCGYSSFPEIEVCLRESGPSGSQSITCLVLFGLRSVTCLKAQPDSETTFSSVSAPAPCPQPPKTTIQESWSAGATNWELGLGTGGWGLGTVKQTPGLGTGNRTRNWELGAVSWELETRNWEPGTTGPAKTFFEGKGKRLPRKRRHLLQYP